MAIRSRAFQVAALGLVVSLAVIAGSYGVSGEATPKMHGQTVRIVADEFRFTPSEINLRAGITTRLTFVNEGKFQHDVVLEGAGVAGNQSLGGGHNAGHGGRNADHPEMQFNSSVHATAPGGGSADVDFTPEPGTYRLLCTITGHSEAGMQGILTVS